MFLYPSVMLMVRNAEPRMCLASIFLLSGPRTRRIWQVRLVIGPLSKNIEAKHILGSAFLTITITEGYKNIWDFPWRWCSRQFVLSFEWSVYKTLLPWCCNMYWFTISSILLWLPLSVEVWFSLDCLKFGNSEALRKVILLWNILSLHLSNSWIPCYIE